ncbi:hypothetical protein N5C46_15010 [Rossellomorea vietnamensis]|uniref:Uncharacterized protein n=1 Tax=Rossellomorea vietnamensis TaxID=218284 RepID=A0ACD4C2Z5_9BACI|nr:hypothetical protein [Rossellomorea vietnamensis]UXH42993.1 hypothetical protein N5C46_15010 [Rossellomorea vietnamensis]
MKKETIFNLSTTELINGLKQAGFSKKANQLKRKSNKHKEKRDQEIGESKNNSKEFRKIIDDIGKSEHYVRFENGEEKLLIHSIDKQLALFERINRSKHTFFYQNLDKEVSLIVCEFYNLNIEVDEDPAKINLDLATSTFDMIHAIEEKELNRMINDQSQAFQIRLFLEAFKANGQKTNHITYVNSTANKTEDVYLFIPAEEYIWSINHEKVNDDQIIATSSSFKSFFEVVQLTVVEYLTSKFSKKGNKKDEKFFSIKRGFVFLIKSNVLLLLFTLLFFLNKNSWALDGEDYVTLFAVQGEALLIILSFIACLRPRILK